MSQDLHSAIFDKGLLTPSLWAVTDKHTYINFIRCTFITTFMSSHQQIVTSFQCCRSLRGLSRSHRLVVEHIICNISLSHQGQHARESHLQLTPSRVKGHCLTFSEGLMLRERWASKHHDTHQHTNVCVTPA